MGANKRQQQDHYLPLKNVALFQELVEKVMRRAEGLPGMACFYGASGFGKSSSATVAANRYECFHVECDDSFTRKVLCERILVQLGMADAIKASVSTMVAMIIDRLAEIGDRPLILDEADFLVKKGMIDIVRAFHDKSQAPVILIGEELLPSKLMAHERAHNRMLDWVAAQPCDIDDARMIARKRFSGIEIGDDLVAAITQASGGRVRRVIVNLDQVVAAAKTNNKRVMRLVDWGNRPFFTGEPPKRRAA